MSFAAGLRIVAVVMLGLVVAHAARVILMSVAGHDRLTTRSLVSEVLTGIGALIMGWGLLPGGSAADETTMLIVCSLVWVIGAVTGPLQRASPGT